MAEMLPRGLPALLKECLPRMGVADSGVRLAALG
jgi:hypothetical protein